MNGPDRLPLRSMLCAELLALPVAGAAAGDANRSLLASILAGQAGGAGCLPADLGLDAAAYGQLLATYFPGADLPAVVRPALIFGGDSVLLHNLGWILRRAPVFALAGDGSYRVRPVHLDDVARLCVEAGTRGDETTVDAVGPERPTYEELVLQVRDAVGSRTRVVHLPTSVVLGASILVILPEVFRQFADYRMIVYALALIVVMILRPQGIMGVKELWETSLWRRLVAKIRRTP